MISRHRAPAAGAGVWRPGAQRRAAAPAAGRAFRRPGHGAGARHQLAGIRAGRHARPGPGRGAGTRQLSGRPAAIGERKICIRLDLPDAETYRGFLPGQPRHGQLAALVYWYLGKCLDVDLALGLPRDRIPAATLGGDAAIGWLAAMRPEGLRPGDTPIEVARSALGRDAGQYSAKGH